MNEKNPNEDAKGKDQPVEEIVTEVNRVPLWDPEHDDVLVCRQVRQETHDVKTFVFSAREPRAFRFYPGQFMTFELPVEGMVTRSYTISASAARPYRVEITVKRVPGGPGSNWLHDYMVPGKEVNVTGPAGDFTTDATADQKLLFISAGSGITPMMSMTRTACDLSEPTDLHFVHAARTPSDLIFRDELALLASQNPGLKVSMTCDSTSASHRWTGYTGRLSLPMLSLMSPDFKDRKVFCCGPGRFMEGVRNMLSENTTRKASISAPKPLVPSKSMNPLHRKSATRNSGSALLKAATLLNAIRG